jgi:hypothetical protein
VSPGVPEAKAEGASVYLGFKKKQSYEYLEFITQSLAWALHETLYVARLLHQRRPAYDSICL